jgi:hypothetical protein
MNTDLNNEIDKEKDTAFEKIRDILFNFGGDKMEGIERARHVLDLLEELSARVIVSCATDVKSVDPLCDTFSKNLQMLSRRFIAEE